MLVGSLCVRSGGAGECIRILVHDKCAQALGVAHSRMRVHVCVRESKSTSVCVFECVRAPAFVSSSSFPIAP